MEQKDSITASTEKIAEEEEASKTEGNDNNNESNAETIKTETQAVAAVVKPEETETGAVKAEETETVPEKPDNTNDTADKINSTEEDADRKKLDFSHRKVMVKNVLKYLNSKKQQQLVQSWVKGTNSKIKICKYKKPPTDDWILVTLEKEDQVPILLDYINNDDNARNRKGGKLFAQPVKANGEDDDDMDEQDSRKRGNNADDRRDTKRQRQEKLQTEAAKPRIVTNEEIKDAMIPLWRSSYKEQLKTKESEIVKRCAIRIVKEIKDKFRKIEKEARRNKNRKPVKLYSWLDKKRSIEVQPLIHSKSIVRNKCEFTFGYRYTKPESSESPTTEPEDGSKEMDATETPASDSKEENDIQEDREITTLNKIASVGAMTRGWSGSVAHPGCCRNIPSEAVAVVDIVESFLKDCPMPPYDSKQHRGFWRLLTVRSSRRTMECMLIFQHAPLAGGEGSKDNEKVDNYSPELFESEKSRLLSMLIDKDLPVTEAKLEEDNEPVGSGGQEKDDPPRHLRVTSIFFQEFGGISMPGPDHPVQVRAFSKKTPFLIILHSSYF